MLNTNIEEIYASKYVQKGKMLHHGVFHIVSVNLWYI